MYTFAMESTIGVCKTTTQLVKQDGLQEGEKSPERDSNGQFVVGNKANPEGKGGFGDNPLHINTRGRPKKGFSWKEILFEVAEKMVPGFDEKSFKEAVVQRLYLEAVNGNISAMRLLFNRMDGPPRRPKVLSSLPTEDHDAEVANLLQEMHKLVHEEELKG